MANGKRRNIIFNYLRNRLRFVEFSVTNACISKCSFCDIWKQRPKVFVDKDAALAAIDRLAELGTGHLTLTGGEPLLHPHIIDFVAHACKRKMHTAVLDAAPKLLLRKNMVERLDDAGCDLISISFDSADPAVMAESRKIPNIMEDMQTALNVIQKTKVSTMASVLIWNNNYNSLEEVCIHAKKMGFNYVSFNYPTFSKSDVYPLGGEGISFSRDKVISGLRDAIRLKKTGKYGIVNSVISMQNIIDYLNNPSQARFFCYGGKHVLFVDWFFKVRPCMQLPYIIGDVHTLKAADLETGHCNGCNMSWYRDFSLFFSGIKAVPVIFDAIAHTRKTA